MNNDIVVVTGGFDPLHSGHIEYLQQAKKLGTALWVGLNSDDWLARKKGRRFLPIQERLQIMSALECVDDVFTFDDTDDTACNAIFYAMSITTFNIIFANGGDRTRYNSPEFKIYGDHTRVQFAWNVGGDKANSSSWILDEWRTQRTERDWGYWRVLDDKPKEGYKVKELVILPGKSLSDQRHFKRSEQWIVLQGTVDMKTEYHNNTQTIQLQAHNRPYKIEKQVWHQAFNSQTENAHILEIQKGSECDEKDIQRR